MKRRVGILISGRGSNMTALIDAARAADYPAEIALVIANRPDAGGLAGAAAAGLPAMVIDHRQFPRNRAGHEATIDADPTTSEHAFFGGHFQPATDQMTFEARATASEFSTVTVTPPVSGNGSGAAVDDTGADAPRGAVTAGVAGRGADWASGAAVAPPPQPVARARASKSALNHE